MIPDEEVERVREAADIVGIIGESVTLKRAGTTFRGPCPFHQGRNPNFSVDPRRRIYHCFKCGESGDVFTFLRKRYGMDWPTSVRHVAERSGVVIREVTTRREGPDPREAVWEVNAAAEDWFRRTLRDDASGNPAREYLAQRDVGLDTADRFGLGFAPRDGSLSAQLATLGFDDARQLEAGLLVKRDDSDAVRPRFRGRLMFPIYDTSGRVAGFGGRVIGAGEPKYLNSPETIAFSKGRMLYGLNWARNAIRRADRVLLVEGYFDLVRLVVAGIEEVIAPLGTALTTEQALLIARHSKNAFLVYDSDKAGLKATFRAADELLRHGASVRVVTLPPGEDPDTFARKTGREGIERCLASAVDVIERKIQLLERGGWFADLHKRRRAIDHLLPTIRATVDPVTRDMYLGRVSEATGVDRQVLTAEADATDRGERQAPPVRQESSRRTAPRAPREPAPAAPRATRRGAGTSAERELVRVMLTSRALIERISERIGPGEFRDDRYREIFERLAAVGPDAVMGDVAAGLAAPSVTVLEALLEEQGAVIDVERTVADCLVQLELRRRRELNAKIQRDLMVATPAETDGLIAEKQANAEEIRRLSESITPA
ncbi:MAG TPA: DNA primase [Gemmatimonadaceae bacterium]